MSDTATLSAPAPAASSSDPATSAPASGAGGTLLSSTPSTPQTQAAPAAEWSWANKDGALSEGWQAKLGGDLANNNSLKTIGSINDLANAYVQTKALVGKKLSMPASDADPAEIANWRKVVGAPDKPEGYLGESKTLRPEGFPEGLWSADNEKQFLEVAHKHSLPPAAVKDILALHAGMTQQGLQAMEGRQAETLKAEEMKLRQQWGTDYDKRSQQAERFARTIFGNDFLNNPNVRAMFGSADMLLAMERGAKLISEDRLVKGEPQSIDGGIQARIDDIISPHSQSQLARDYRGENGPERGNQAQQILHNLRDSLNSNRR